MNLSKRLQAVATLVDVGFKVIDVGCDHGYLDIYLTLNNENKCLAIDINENALNVAKSNIEKYKLTKKIDTKLNDGLKDINVNSEDNIVISGMGAHTIVKILSEGALSDTLIISSNNDIEYLRKEVINLGYFIESEIFIIDKNKPYVIIKFKKGFKKYRKIDYLVGPILKNNVEYKRYLSNKYKKVLNNLSKRKIFLKFKYLLLLLRLKILI